MKNAEKWILLTLLLTPVWWVLGVNVFIYQVIIFFFFFKLVFNMIMSRASFALPKPVMWLALFLWFYFLSVLINIGNQPAQRLLASFNNYLLYVMGFMMMLLLYRDASENWIPEFFRTAKNISFISGILTLVFVALWFAGLKHIEFDALLARLLPVVKNSPFFYLLTTIRVTGTDWFMEQVPRISLYSIAFIGSGNFMAMMLPGLMGYYALTKSRWIFAVVFLTAFLPLAFSLSRTAVCSFIGAYIFVTVIEKGTKFYWAIIYLMLGVLSAGSIYHGLEWLFNFRSHSTIGRLDVYQDAIEMVMENNPLMGLGVRIREGFSLMQIGSHSNYVELLLVTGMLGLAIFVSFQVSTFILWWRDKRYLQTSEEKIYWKYLGMSFIGANGTILTSSLSALPFIAYTYFLVVSSILVLSKQVRKHYLETHPEAGEERYDG